MQILTKKFHVHTGFAHSRHDKRSHSVLKHNRILDPIEIDCIHISGCRHISLWHVKWKETKNYSIVLWLSRRSHGFAKHGSKAMTVIHHQLIKKKKTERKKKLKIACNIFKVGYWIHCCVTEIILLFCCCCCCTVETLLFSYMVFAIFHFLERMCIFSKIMKIIGWVDDGMPFVIMMIITTDILWSDEGVFQTLK